jgi:hypothetical protein
MKKKIVDLLQYSEWLKMLELTMKWPLCPKQFFCHFPFFLKDYNNPQGYADWKCKKVENQPTLLDIVPHLCTNYIHVCVFDSTIGGRVSWQGEKGDTAVLNLSALEALVNTLRWTTADIYTQYCL